VVPHELPLVGLEEVDDDRWKVYFGPIELGVLDVRNAKARGYRQFGLLVRTDGTILLVIAAELADDASDT
jgi:hypothetical protein